VGNIGKNTASYEVMDPNPIPPWLEELINPDTPNPGNIPGLITNTGPGNDGGSNKPGSGTIGGNDQLYRDQMYIRNTLTYTPTTDPNTNTTTPPPEMPGWEIDTSVIEQLLLAACLVSGGLAFAFLSDSNMKNKIAKYAVDKAAGKKFVFHPQDVALFALDIVCFLVKPDLFSWVMIVVQTFAFMQLISLLTKASQTNIYAIFTAVITMLSLAVILKNIADNKLNNSPLFDAIDWVEQVVKEFIKKMFGI
jgi:hypothetical protein